METIVLLKVIHKSESSIQSAFCLGQSEILRGESNYCSLKTWRCLNNHYDSRHTKHTYFYSVSKMLENNHADIIQNLWGIHVLSYKVTVWGFRLLQPPQGWEMVGGNVMDCLPDELEQRRDKAKEQIPRSSRACLLPVSINEDSYWSNSSAPKVEVSSDTSLLSSPVSNWDANSVSADITLVQATLLVFRFSYHHWFLTGLLVPTIVPLIYFRPSS